MTITITVTNRIATISATERIVAGNTYPVTLALDSEWTGSLYARVRFGSQYYDIPFASTDTAVNVQFPVGYPEVGIGVFSEALEICSNEVRVRLLRSILEQGVSVVEFDSDLYDQWAGEVSELLCDDAFDSTSDRPVKNSVITAWKNTVPLDSALVHKTGAETIAGAKTFTSRPEVNFGNPILALIDPRSYSGSSNRGGVEFYGQYSTGTVGRLGGIGIWQSVSGSGSRQSFLMRAQDQGGTAEVAISRFVDGHSEFTAPSHLPVDGSSNPLAPGNTEVMTSAMLAVDPRIVHTSGIETVAGDKTFTGRIYGYRVLSRDTSAYGTGNAKCGIGLLAKGENGSEISYASAFLWQTYTGENKRNSLSINVKSLDGASESSIELWKMADNSTRLFVPSHTPVDGSGNHLAPVSGEAMTSAMLAVDPRVVHTTGNETVAGNKTFSGQVSFEKPISQMAGFVANLTGWTRIYEVTSHQNGGNIRIHADPAVSAKKPTEAQLYVSGNAGSMSFIEIARDFDVSIVAVRRASDKHIEIWCRGAWALWSVPFLYRHNVAHGDNAYSETAPAVGSTYDMIATFN